MEREDVGCLRFEHQRERRSMATILSPLSGTWTYRSFRNDPDHENDINRLLYGEGDLIVEEAPMGAFAGRLMLGSDYQLDLRGFASYGLPFTVRFQGVGTAGSKAEGWIYDYMAFVVPDWPNGVDQIPAMVGSNIRTVPHDGSPAGLVASWIALKQDE
jgi:hypothetical protein